MSTHLEWYEIALRLALTVAAGALIGANRGGHGHAAGLRTVMLVCLAASISMIQANLLLGTVGKSPDSFIVLDLMRLPLGILSGMGFILISPFILLPSCKLPRSPSEDEGRRRLRQGSYLLIPVSRPHIGIWPPVAP